MGRTRVRGLHLNVQQDGQGPELVLIHGLAADLAFWYFRHLPRLKQHFHTTIYDLRGHGRSDMPPSGYGCQNQANDLAALLDALQISNAHLVGHSFGGLVALAFAIGYPERVNRLAIADGRVGLLQPAHTTADWPFFEAWKAHMAGRGLDDSDELIPGLGALTSAAKASERDSASKSLEPFFPFGSWNGGKRSARLWLRLLSSTAAPSELLDESGLSLEAIRSVNSPACAIYGARSFCLPSGKALQRLLPDCRTVIVPEAGHFHPLTHPQAFVSSLESFLINNTDNHQVPPARQATDERG
jgi:pimeloyl-ACP methyl ester carboxylesterase